MKTRILLTAACLFTFVGISVAQTDTIAVTKDLQATGLLSKEHTRLLVMLKLAGLEPKAREAGPYTIFAPTNAAFDKLPSGSADNLLKPAYRARLIQVLTLHVVPGRLIIKDLQDGQLLKTVGGEVLTVQRVNEVVSIVDGRGNKATISQANIRATNGLVHVVDTVLMPR